MRRAVASRWLDPTGWRAAVVLSLLAAVGNAVWIFLDSATPAWDSAHYLNVAMQYRHGFAADGLDGLFTAIWTTDPFRGPLLPAAMAPFLYLFGNSPRSALLLNAAIAPALYIAAGQIGWLIFRDWRARLLAIALVATMPLMVGLHHAVLQDFLLVTVATVTVLLLLLSDRFTNRRISLALGIALGLGTLTKVTFPAFVAGPAIVVLTQTAGGWRARSAGDGPDAAPRAQIRNMLLALAAYLAVILPWYWPNFSETVDYVRSTTSGPLAEGAGPEDPLTFDAAAGFTSGVLNEHLSWVIVLAGLLAAALCAPRIARRIREPRGSRAVPGVVLLLSWAAIPYLLLVTGHNQDVRLMAPAMPAVAILVAGAMAAVRPPAARRALVAVTVTVLVYQAVNHTARITPSFLPSELAVEVGGYAARIPLDEDEIGYQRLPGEDYGTPIVEWIEGVAARERRGFGPRTVCLLQSHPITNANTFGFLITSRGDPFSVVDVLVGPDGKAGLRRTLEGCDFAVFVRQPPVTADNEGQRITIVNEDYAARHMSPELFALFRGPSRSFALAPADPEEARYLANPGGSTVARVLSRRPLRIAGTRQAASATIRPPIFERPARRSRKTIGTSTTRNPARAAR